MTWTESVDVALCFGWIDGVRKSLSADAYTIRFTPRRKVSIWSAVNIRKAEELTAAGRMRPPGLEAFRARDEARSRRYSFERESVALPVDLEEQFREHSQAWEFFASMPPSYRKPRSLVGGQCQTG